MNEWMNNKRFVFRGSRWIWVSSVGFSMIVLNRHKQVQGDHFPDNMKFPTFPVKASKDYPVSSVYWFGQQSLFHINENQGEAR